MIFTPFISLHLFKMILNSLRPLSPSKIPSKISPSHNKNLLFLSLKYPFKVLSLSPPHSQTNHHLSYPVSCKLIPHTQQINAPPHPIPTQSLHKTTPCKNTLPCVWVL